MIYTRFIFFIFCILTFAFTFLCGKQKKFLVPTLLGWIACMILAIIVMFQDNTISFDDYYVRAGLVLGIINQVIAIIKPTKGTFKSKITVDFIVPWFLGSIFAFGLWLIQSKEIGTGVFLIIFVALIDILITYSRFKTNGYFNNK